MVQLMFVSVRLLVVSVTVRKVCGSAVSGRLCGVAGLRDVAGRLCSRHGDRLGECVLECMSRRVGLGEPVLNCAS